MHTEKWYSALALALGHPGYLTLAEIRQAEARGWQPSDRF